MARMNEAAWYSSGRLGRKGHAAVVALFVGVGVFYAAACWPSPYRGGDLINIATMLAKDADPTLFAKDFTFGSVQYYRTYLPMYRAAMLAASRVAGSTLAAHKLLVLFMAPAYLAAMFLLLKELTGNWVVSLAVALASMTPRGSLHYQWGLGPLSTAVPR